MSCLRSVSYCSNTSGELTYNPSTKHLSVDNYLCGTWAGNAITAYVERNLETEHYTKGDLLVGGLGNTLIVTPKGAVLIDIY